MKRPSYILVAAVVGAIALIIYFFTRTPGGVTPMNGDNSEATAWISLAVAVVGLAAALVGLVQRFVELRAMRRE